MVDNQVSDEFDHEMNHQISMEYHTNDQCVLIKMKKKLESEKICLKKPLRYNSCKLILTEPILSSKIKSLS